MSEYPASISVEPYHLQNATETPKMHVGIDSHAKFNRRRNSNTSKKKPTLFEKKLDFRAFRLSWKLWCHKYVLKLYAIVSYCFVIVESSPCFMMFYGTIIVVVIVHWSEVCYHLLWLSHVIPTAWASTPACTGLGMCEWAWCLWTLLCT